MGNLQKMSHSNDSNLLREIQSELIQETCIFSDTLRKALVLAHRISSDSLKSWVNQELNGYTDMANLPTYRTLDVSSLANYSVYNGGGVYLISNFPINIGFEYAHRRPILHGISTLDDLLKNGSSVVEIDWAPYAFEVLAKQFNAEGKELTRVWHQISTSAISQIIDSAKTRLLNFVLELEGYAENSGNGFTNIQNPDIEKLVQTIIIQGDVIMTRDQYNIDQAGAVGPGAKAEGMTFNQIQLNYQGEVDISALSTDLSKLREAMRQNAQEPEHFVELGNIAAAEAEAKEGNKSKAFEALAKVSKWAVETATMIGATVAAEAIKSSIGLQP